MFKKKFNIFNIKEDSIRDRKISGFFSRQREGADFPGVFEERPLGLQLENFYLKVLISLAVLTGIIILGRVVYLQIFKSAIYKALAEGNRIKIERTIAPRGIIYDRDLKPLVKNNPIFSLKIISENLPNSSDELSNLSEKVAEILGNDSHFKNKNLSEFLNQKILENKGQKPVVTLANEIDLATAISFKLEKNLPGILLEQGIRREYLANHSSSHILGYLGNITQDEWPNYQNLEYYFGDLIGRAGVESQYEQELKGQDELIKIEINARGEEIKIVSKEGLKAGNNLVLSIDLDLQKKLNEVLKAYAGITSGRGAAVAVNPKTGEILALISLPDYDNNAFIKKSNETIEKILQDHNQPLFNRAISGTYPPGSTFKPIVAAAALAEKIITPTTVFYSSGGIKLDKWFFPDWKAGGHGWTNLNKAIAESVNTYFYYIGGGYEDFTGLGVNIINKYAKKFGLASILGIDLPGEAQGFLPTKQWKEKNKNEPWYIGDTYHLSIGQGDILITPLQLAMVTTVFANNGILYQPYLVKSLLDKSDKLLRIFEPIIINNQVLPKDNISTVRRAYREAVLSGSAISLQSLPVNAAGKTGTAQVGGSQEPHAWFTGWAPYKNPEIVLTILIENGIGGNTSALPVFKEVIRWYFSK